MLREFQDEILRLKAELAATASQPQPSAQHHEQRVERIVERPLSAEEVLAMRAQMEQEMQQEAVQQGEPLDAETLAKVRPAFHQLQRQQFCNCIELCICGLCVVATVLQCGCSVVPPPVCSLLWQKAVQHRNTYSRSSSSSSSSSSSQCKAKQQQ